MKNNKGWTYSTLRVDIDTGELLPKDTTVLLYTKIEIKKEINHANKHVQYTVIYKRSQQLKLF